MRKITSEAVSAFYAGENYKNANTKIERSVLQGNNTKYISYLLHDNIIAIKDENGKVSITLAGWNTNTTRERLNGLQGVKITTKQGQAYLNGKEWGGEWITITE